VPIRLTIKRRRKLEQIVAAATSPQRLVFRARIVLAAAGGAANAVIARDLDCGVAVVRTWRGRFACRGIQGLFDKPQSGRPETHGPSARLAVAAVATSVPPGGEPQWSHALIAGHLRERGLAISAATVGRVLAEAMVRPHKVRGWLNRADGCRAAATSPPATTSKQRSPRSPSGTTNTPAPTSSYDTDADHARYLEGHRQPQPVPALAEAAWPQRSVTKNHKQKDRRVAENQARPRGRRREPWACPEVFPSNERPMKLAWRRSAFMALRRMGCVDGSSPRPGGRRGGHPRLHLATRWP